MGISIRAREDPTVAIVCKDYKWNTVQEAQDAIPKFVKNINAVLEKKGSPKRIKEEEFFVHDSVDEENALNFIKTL